MTIRVLSFFPVLFSHTVMTITTGHFGSLEAANPTSGPKAAPVISSALNGDVHKEAKGVIQARDLCFWIACRFGERPRSSLVFPWLGEKSQFSSAVSGVTEPIRFSGCILMGSQTQ